jgi:hypothetical protein
MLSDALDFTGLILAISAMVGVSCSTCVSWLAARQADAGTAAGSVSASASRQGFASQSGNELGRYTETG